MRILFADLDRTLTETKTGSTIAKGTWDWKIKEGVIEAIKGYSPDHLRIVTNQGGIGTGRVKETDWLAKIDRIIQRITSELRVVVSFDYCTSNNPMDPMRKPNPGMITGFLKHWPEAETLMIGDASGKPGQWSDSDRKAAENAGIPYLDVNDFIQRYGKT